VKAYIGAILLVSAASVLALSSVSARPQETGTNTGLPWAYGFATPAPANGAPAGGRGGAPAGGGAAAAAPAEPPEDRDAVHHLPDTTLTFSIKDIANNYAPADWYPGDHPAMPDIVAHGRKPDVNACGFCHYPNGKGRPNNAGPAGLPAAYILQQIQDFKDGSRDTADKRKRNEGQMIAIAKALTPEEAQAAANYFASMKWTPYVKVVEAAMVPKTRYVGGGGGLCMPLTGAEAGTEPIGDRLIEIPVNPDETEPLRDPRAGFIAYVAPGTLKKGQAIVEGAGGTLACAMCHGQGLKGNDQFPSLAGRSPSYLARQINDFKHMTRNGPGAKKMLPIVQNLSDDDILAVTAYVASLQP
jgi:cytochrome c553